MFLKLTQTGFDIQYFISNSLIASFLSAAHLFCERSGNMRPWGKKH